MDLTEPERCMLLRPDLRSPARHPQRSGFLLAAYLEAGDFIESAIATEIGDDGPANAAAQPPDWALAGKRNEAGSMATVYLGQRDDGQFSKDVAVKLIGASRPIRIPAPLRRRTPDPGDAGTSQYRPIVRRGGVTGDGLPYIIMEYIEGLPIDRYCERNSLRLAERLELCQTICSAVHLAHKRSYCIAI